MIPGSHRPFYSQFTVFVEKITPGHHWLLCQPMLVKQKQDKRLTPQKAERVKNCIVIKRGTSLPFDPRRWFIGRQSILKHIGGDQTAAVVTSVMPQKVLYK